MMKVQVVSTETIKPSSSTPTHKRSYKLCLFDQCHVVVPSYISLVLFYSSPIETPKTRSDKLKQSLSNTLTFFYPFAGRVKDTLTIDCNDEGAIFMEAQVDSDISTVLKDPEISHLQQLLPFDPHENLPTDPTARVMVAIQVNYFGCGGMAIGVCINHVIADASATASFLNSWAALSSGAANRIEIDRSNVIYDSTTFFPPQDLSNILNFLIKISRPVPADQGNLVTKRFLIEGGKITCLRNEMRNASASRFEAVAALLWGAMIALAGNNDETTLPSMATVTLNLRNRTNPPLPQQCIGNVIDSVMVKSPMERTVNMSSLLAAKIRESLRKVDDDYVKKIHADGAYYDILANKYEKFGRNWMFHFASWCRFPFYESDFGWGKPIWLGTAWRLKRFVIFLDTKDGKGIEAWLTLTEEEMAKLEQDPAILTYATFKPNI